MVSRVVRENTEENVISFELCGVECWPSDTNGRQTRSPTVTNISGRQENLLLSWTKRRKLQHDLYVDATRTRSGTWIIRAASNIKEAARGSTSNVKTQRKTGWTNVRL